ncbi:MAG: hypothetical protein GY845_38405 [Planctomycetes bacterium]|nr:hypothetical protein [Planctomycetota bacterium]
MFGSIQGKRLAMWIFSGVLILGTVCCENSDLVTERTSTDQVPQDTDSDADGDTDSDADGDTDTDTDTDADADTDSDTDGDADSDSDSNSDADSDADGDTDSDSDTDSDADSDTDGDADSDIDTDEVLSFIWIANSQDGTLSKIDTITAKEVARYITSPQGAGGDPSRTSVNMHGDMVVTNREPTTGPSSVTKFAANNDDCVDRNSNGVIDTSTGLNDIKPWGEDECMLWNSPLDGLGSETGARATAWDGEVNKDTGKGGHIWIGTTISKSIYKLDGDTGDILGKKVISIGSYGGAVDGKGSFWIVDDRCPAAFLAIMPCFLGRVRMDTLEVSLHKIKGAYGISVDSKGRIWTAGINRTVSRYDPEADKAEAIVAGDVSNRGVAVDGDGSVWIAGTLGRVVQVNEDTMNVIRNFPVGTPDLVGVAVDFKGYVWAVSQGGNMAYKIDPKTYKNTRVPIGQGPYTYSDMTGMQLKQVIVVVK